MIKSIQLTSKIVFIKKHVVNKDYKGRVIEIGSGNGKLLFRM